MAPDSQLHQNIPTDWNAFIYILSGETFFGEFYTLHLYTFNPRPRGLLVSSNYGTNSLTTLRATALFVLMHSGIVNGYQLLCDAHTVVEPHRGTAASLVTHYRPFPLFLFMCFSL